MADKPVGEVVAVDAVLDGLSSPTSSDVYEAVQPYSNDAVAAVAAKRALTGGGGGGSQDVYVQDADPGAVGSGKLWVQTGAGEPPYVMVRSDADDAWNTIYPPDTPASPTLAAVLNESNDAEGNNIDNGGDFTMGGATIGSTLAHTGTTVGFYNADPVTQQTYDSSASDTARIGVIEGIILYLGLAVDTAP